ncbi:hypothetical protein AB0H37_38335 [Actinomadura sp. NPDC023710]|uniref:hypothetical protein n=1 Tax=Actinomadura sp. NPDC023710 TaxID=3158219 RepID=UPI0033CA4BE5
MRVTLLADGSLRVPDAVVDPEAGGIAHTTRHVGPDHPAYEQLRRLAVPEGAQEEPGPEDSTRQAELDAFLDAHADAGDSMLRLLEWQLRHRRAS